MEPKEEKRERWRVLIEQYQQGKKTQKAFCKSQGLTLWVFRYWLRKYQRPLEQSSNQLLPVRVTQTPTVSARPILLSFSNGLEMRFDYPIIAEELAVLVAQLQRAL